MPIDIHELSAQRMCIPGAGSTVHFFPIADLYDEHDEFFTLNRIDDPVAAFMDTVEVIRSGERFELAFHRWSEKNGVGHGRLEAKIFQNRIERLCPFLFGFSKRGSGISKIDPIF